MNKSIVTGAVSGLATSTAALAIYGFMAGSPTTPDPQAEPAVATVSQLEPAQAAAPQPVKAVAPAPVYQPPVYVQPKPQTVSAPVLGVSAVTRSVPVNEEVCRDVVVQTPVRDEHRVTGKVLGAVIGGVIGHQFGSGRGNDAATAGGAIIGGVIGDKVQKDQQQAHSQVVQQCEMVQSQKAETIGYEVRYRLNGREQTRFMESRPGDTLVFRDGELVSSI